MSPAHAARPKEEPGDDKAKAPPSVLGVPLTKWAIAAVSGIFVGYVAIHFGLKAYGEYQQTKEENAKLQTEAQKLGDANKKLTDTQNALTAQTDTKVSERTRHLEIMHEKGISSRVPPDNGLPGAIVTFYKSDGCVRLVRDGNTPGPYGITSGQELWIPDPSKSAVAAAGQVTTGEAAWIEEQRKEAASPAKGDSATPAAGKPGIKPRLLRAADEPGNAKTRLLPVQSGCMNPHPWAFNGRWGRANGCIVQYWRSWRDGCQHYQVYNSCTGQWYPQIYWVRCSSQHHP